ncbi:hypothetical protein FE257_010016 [Aspergillus nanangensis]|uniref:ACB domain-containing protein n=1 Tax=Aspergillus nanangensis TaxID=2582783 RepID=A0AAD4GYF1_ASPNN|nr:hypothetical protein FE257_010016 [Aspergillus nanangensis]
MSDFYTALSAAQNKAQYTPAVQSKAEGIDVDTLKVAIDLVLGGDDSASVQGAQADALKAGFLFAAELVNMLEKKPTNDELLKLYGYFKQANGETLEQPGMFDLKGKAKYNAWKAINTISAQKAQAEYVTLVSGLVKSYGTQE